LPRTFGAGLVFCLSGGELGYGGGNEGVVMKMIILVMMVLVSVAGAQVVPVEVHEGVTDLVVGQGEPVDVGGGYYDVSRDEPCLTEDQRAAMILDLKESIRVLRADGILPAVDELALVTGLSWPIRGADHVRDPGVHGISGFVDQNSNYPDQLLDYNCGSRTYDLSSGYNHQGTDIFTWPYAWHKMDNDDVEIVAAAAGVIVQKYDGNYDRNCGFGSGNWNAVYVQHADGSTAWYGHMKSGSLTSKSIGQSVTTGEFLGVVGSSGSSTGPHLHFELYDQAWNLIDPWVGACNSMSPTSWWVDQPAYYDSAINALRTHSAPPDWQACPTPAVTHEELFFNAGELVYFMTYYRDQILGQVSNYEILRPGGAVWRSWNGTMSEVHYAASYWWWSWVLPVDAEDGWWTFRVTFEGQTEEYLFAVGAPGPTDVPTVGSFAELHAPRPNPFNPATEIAFTMSKPGNVRLRVYDLRGRVMATLVDGHIEAGRHAAVWDGRNDAGGPVASGAYLMQLETGGELFSRLVSLIE
jgi:murein DD-endopeptidase MepM/ murein hydrolase activator NlpD